MLFRTAFIVLTLAALPNLAEAQSSGGKRQRTPEQEARREARREVCRDEAGKVFTARRDRSREMKRQYVRDCMRRSRKSR